MMVNGLAGLSLYNVSKVRVLQWFLGIIIIIIIII